MNFLILCVTGVILVWKDEIEGNQVKVNSSYQNIELNEAYSVVSNKVRSLYPDKRILSIFKDDNGLIQVRLGEPNQEKFKGALRKSYYKNAQEFFKKENKNSKGLIEWLLELHRQLFLGGKGKLLVGFIGLILLFVLTSGAFIIPYFKGLKDKAGSRFKISRVHQKIGALTFSWLILITLTGVFLALNSTLIGLFLKGSLEQQRSLVREEIVYVEHSLEDVINVVADNSKSYEIDFIAYPNTEFSLPLTYAFLLEKKGNQKIAFVKSNKDLEISFVELPWYLKLLVISEPLHFGNYGGVGLKIFWTLFGLLAGVIPFTGLANYYYRKLKKKRTVGVKAISSAKRSNFLFGSIQAVSLGIIPLVSFNSGIELSNVMIFFGLSILLYILGTRFWARRIGEIEVKDLYSIAYIGLFFSILFLACSIAFSGLFSFGFYLLSRLAFCLLASLCLPLSQVVFVESSHKKVEKGLISHGFMLDMGRMFGLLSIILMPFDKNLILFGWALVSGLILIRHSLTKEINLSLTSSISEDLNPKKLSSNLLLALLFTIIMGAINAQFPFLLRDIISDSSKVTDSFYQILLFANVVMMASHLIVKRGNLVNSNFIKIFIGLLFVITPILISYAQTLSLIWVLAFVVSVVAACFPILYGKIIYHSNKAQSSAKISSEMAISQTLGNALGTIIIGIIIGYRDFTVIYYFTLIIVFLSLFYKSTTILKEGNYAK